MTPEFKAQFDGKFRELITKARLASERLTEDQLVDLLGQLFSSGDIYKNVVASTGAQAMVYVPYNRCQGLENEIERLRTLLTKHGIDHKQPVDLIDEP